MSIKINFILVYKFSLKIIKTKNIYIYCIFYLFRKKPLNLNLYYFQMSFNILQMIAYDKFILILFIYIKL